MCDPTQVIFQHIKFNISLFENLNIPFIQFNAQLIVCLLFLMIMV